MGGPQRADDAVDAGAGGLGDDQAGLARAAGAEASSSWLSSWSKLEVTRPNLARTPHLAKDVAGTVGDDDVDPELEAAVDLGVVVDVQTYTW